MTTASALQATVQEPLLGRTALVTGASRGIGAAVARRLDAAGARVALAARSVDDLHRVAGGLRHDPVVLEVDLADPLAPTQLAERADRELGGRVDVLVNNAGVFTAGGPSHLLDADAVDAAFALNVRPALLLTGAVAAGMATRGSGSVVNVSSAAGLRGTPYSATYAATKGALDAATRALAAEHGPAGVRVNAVLPGITVTSMTGRLFDDPAVVAFYTARVALRRMGRPEDVADVVAFLASDAARYVTAQTVVVDGGWADTGAIFPAPA